VTDPVRWFEALGVRYFRGRQLSSPRTANAHQRASNRVLCLLLSHRWVLSGDVNIRVRDCSRCGLSEWSIMLQPWRNIELEGGSLGRHRRGRSLFRMEWWVVMGPKPGGLLTLVGRCPKRYFTATARGHAAMHYLALSLRSERWHTPRDALKVFGVK
jgi:hypothetical protein